MPISLKAVAQELQALAPGYVMSVVPVSDSINIGSMDGRTVCTVTRAMIDDNVHRDFVRNAVRLNSVTASTSDYAGNWKLNSAGATLDQGLFGEFPGSLIGDNWREHMRAGMRAFDQVTSGVNQREVYAAAARLAALPDPPAHSVHDIPGILASVEHWRGEAERNLKLLREAREHECEMRAEYLAEIERLRKEVEWAIQTRDAYGVAIDALTARLAKHEPPPPPSQSERAVSAMRAVDKLR